MIFSGLVITAIAWLSPNIRKKSGLVKLQAFFPFFGKMFSAIVQTFKPYAETYTDRAQIKIISSI